MKYKHLNIIAHSLGIRLFESVILNDKKFKTLPKEFYRNYYNTGENTDAFVYIKELIELGFMDKNYGDYYYVTELGRAEFVSQFTSLAIYLPAKDRNEDYLKHQIAFYCQFYNYKFGDDNVGHVISSYQNYILKGHSVSHTTGDVINRFKRQLKKFYGQKILA